MTLSISTGVQDASAPNGRESLGRPPLEGTRVPAAGFKRVGDRCEKLQVPEHAFLESAGNRWQCERGYKRVKEQCQAVQVPVAFPLKTEPVL